MIYVHPSPAIVADRLGSRLSIDASTLYPPFRATCARPQGSVYRCSADSHAESGSYTRTFYRVALDRSGRISRVTIVGAIA